MKDSLSDDQPLIRFAGFTGDWEQRKLSEIADKAVDNRGKTPIISEDGTHPLLEVASLGNGAPDYTKVTKYLSDETFENELRAHIKEGDILFSTVGSIGLVSLMDTNENAAIAQNIVAFRANEKYDSKFLYAMLSTEDNQYKAQRIVMGAVQPSIKVSQLVDVEYCVTENKEEQRKLGEYFRNLDALITLHQRKYDSLTILKKSMLEKMFPKSGEAVPEIRFAGFTGDWEQREFSDIAETRRGLTYKPSNISENGIRVLRSSNIDEDTFVYGKDDVFVELDAVNIPFVKNGDILITSANGSSRLVGKHSIIKNLSKNTAVHGGFMLIASCDNPEFLNASMSSNWYSNFINTYVAGGNGAIGNLSKSDLDLQEILVPSIDEQKAIGTYFKNLDTLITLHQSKCDSLKRLKKAMSQNMFI